MVWANINRAIVELVKNCPPCQHHQKLNVTEPLLPHDVPQKPWHTLGSDKFQWNNANCLLVVDYHSKFPVVKTLTSIQSSAVIAHLRSVFKHGISSKLVPDNGTGYTCIHTYITYLPPPRSSVIAMDLLMSHPVPSIPSPMVLVRRRCRL